MIGTEMQEASQLTDLGLTDLIKVLNMNHVHPDVEDQSCSGDHHHSLIEQGIFHLPLRSVQSIHDFIVVFHL